MKLNIFPFNNKEESFVIAFVLVVIMALTFVNLQISFRRSRDFQRKEDVNSLSFNLFRFHEEFGFYPPSSEKGEVLACKKDDLPEDTTNIPLDELYAPCRYGFDALQDLTDLTREPYMRALPSDPDTDKGVSYFYVSNLKEFQFLTALEGEDEAEYNLKVRARGLPCGNQICNYGKGSSNLPLDKELPKIVN